MKGKIDMSFTDILVYSFFFVFWVAFIVLHIRGGSISYETKGLLPQIEELVKLIKK